MHFDSDTFSQIATNSFWVSPTNPDMFKYIREVVVSRYSTMFSTNCFYGSNLRLNSLFCCRANLSLASFSSYFSVFSCFSSI